MAPTVTRPPLMIEGTLVTHLDTGYRIELAAHGSTFTVDLERTAGGYWLTIVEDGSIYATEPPRFALDRLGRLTPAVYGLPTPRYLLVAARALRALELDGIL